MTFSGHADISVRYFRSRHRHLSFSHTEMAGQKGGSPTETTWENLMLHYMRMRLQTMTRNEHGASAVEYGLLVGLIAVAIIITVGLLGGELDRLFGLVEDSLANAG
jgi:pilus assembly protein Flp/PilA